MPHLIAKHNLNIQAGFGYEPVMRYDIGYDKNNVRIALNRNDDVRYLMKAKKGTLTLEGLRMEMDPLKTGDKKKVLECYLCEWRESTNAQLSNF